MAFESLLKRWGFVKLERYGLALTPEGRVLTTRPASLDDGIGGRVVGWRDDDLAAMELARWQPPARRDAVAAPVPAPVPPPPAPPKLSVKPVAPPSHLDEDEGEWEWEIALARVRAAADAPPNLPPTRHARPTTNPPPSTAPMPQPILLTPKPPRPTQISAAAPAAPRPPVRHVPLKTRPLPILTAAPPPPPPTPTRRIAKGTNPGATADNHDVGDATSVGLTPAPVRTRAPSQAPATRSPFADDDHTVPNIPLDDRTHPGLTLPVEPRRVSLPSIRGR